MQIKITRKKVIIAIISVLIYLLAISCLAKIIMNRIPYQNSLKWESGWTIYINDSIIQPKELSKVTFDAASKGEVVVLENTIPKTDYTAPNLRLWMCHSAIRVLIDGSAIYNYGWERYEHNQTIGNGFHWIPIDKMAEGKTIRIEFYPIEDNAFTNISAIYYGEAIDSGKDLVSDTFKTICAGVFLCMFGFVIIMIAICMSCVLKQSMSLVFTGLFSMDIGIWSLCNHGDFQLISNNLILNQYLEYYSLYTGSLMLLLFMNSIRNKGEKSKVLYGFIVANTSLVVLTILLHGLQIVQFPSMLPYYHIFDLVAIIYVILSCIRRIRQGNSEEHLMLTGISILAACFFYDIIMFNIAKYFDGVLSGLMGITSIGGIIFIFCMLFSYALHIYHGICNQVERETLLGMAYTDNLTRTANVAKFNEVTAAYDQSKQPYTIIIFDLNNLKLVNDNQGHNRGDLLIHSFANVLRKTFDKYGTVARIGGDEFAVLMPDMDSEIMNVRMQNYEKNLMEENKKDVGFTIEAAWGIASSTENSGLDAMETKKLADFRMYEKKHVMKDMNGTSYNS